MKSLWTTIGGIVFAIGTILATSEDPTLRTIGVIITALGGLFGFAAAKDFNVTGGTKSNHIVEDDKKTN